MSDQADVNIEHLVSLWQALPINRRPTIADFARQHNIPSNSTFYYRINGRQSRKQAHEYRQILTLVEEESLVEFMRRCQAVGHPATPATIIGIANQMRQQRITSALVPDGIIPCLPPPVSYPWLEKFRLRHPQVKSTYTRKIEASRYSATTVDALAPWFCEMKTLLDKNNYTPQNIYNMDETGYAIGETQSCQVLVVIEEDERIGSRRGKKKPSAATPGRQEWVTTIECVSANGVALPPLIIFKAENTFNTGWLPEDLQIRGWNWSISSSGWSNNDIAYKWLSEVFQPNTLPSNPAHRRLLIIDGHATHVQPRFIAFCINNAIDLMILPPHSSHVTQPLDVGVFRHLKQAMAKEVRTYAQYDESRIQRYEWVRHLAAARLQAMNQKNISLGWKYSGLHPYVPHIVLDAAPRRPPAPATPPRTPLGSLSIENRSFIAQHSSDMSPEVKYHLTKVTSTLEKISTEKVILAKENFDLRKVLEVKKKQRKGVTVPNVKSHLFSTQRVLDMAEDLAKERAAKKKRKRATSDDEEEAEDDQDNAQTSVDRLGTPCDY